MARYNLVVSEGEVGYYDILTYCGIPSEEGEEVLSHSLSWYHYDPTRPPFWVAGVFETRAYTLPYAVFCDVYDTAQSNEHIKDGDEFVFSHDGQEYVIVIDRAWPRCESAQALEDDYRAIHGIAK